MTDNRTNEPTPEQILVDEWIRQADLAKSMTGMDAIWFPDAEETLAALRTHGLLSDSAPSEQQVEAAAKAAYEYAQENATVPMPRREWESLGWIERGLFEGEARAALEAAARAAQGAEPQAEQATYLNVAHSSVLAGSINARRAAREVSAMQLIDAIYDPDEDDANDSVRYGYVLEQFERLRVIYADLDDPDAGPAPVLPSSGVDEETLASLIHSTSVAHFGGLDPRVAPIIARAVAEWLKGQGNAARE